MPMVSEYYKVRRKFGKDKISFKMRTVCQMWQSMLHDVDVYIEHINNVALSVEVYIKDEEEPSHVFSVYTDSVMQVQLKCAKVIQQVCERLLL